MDKFVPYEKLSKKQKKAADRAKRTVWVMNPVTRKPENPKAYNRRKALYGDHDPGEVLFLILYSSFLQADIPKRNEVWYTENR